MDFLNEAGVQVTDQFLVVRNEKFEISKIISAKPAPAARPPCAVCALLLCGCILIMLFHPLCSLPFIAAAAYFVIVHDKKPCRIILTVSTAATTQVFTGLDAKMLSKLEDAICNAKKVRKP